MLWAHLRVCVWILRRIGGHLVSVDCPSDICLVSI